MKGHVIAEELVEKFGERNMNEADTRHRIIDRLLHEILAWPHDRVRCEKSVHEGYLDYVLNDPAGRPALLIEAKKEGAFFTLPKTVVKSDAPRMIRLKTLATDPKIKSAVVQAALYCPSIGCQYACVTNGHEFIVFRAFIPGKEFLDADAWVVPKLSSISSHFTEVYNTLGYQAVTVDRSLQRQLASQSSLSRDLFYPKSGINHYDGAVQLNRFAKYLDPIAREYFGEIQSTDKRMMDKCFVFARGAKMVADGMKTRLSDDLTDFFKADGAVELARTRDGGKLGERIARALSKQNAGEILILYGGKGAGKSTFLRRILYHDPPTEFVLKGIPIIVDCIRLPQEREKATDFFWDQITAALDQPCFLAGSMEQLLVLFEDRFDVARKQELDGFSMGSAEYLRERNALVAKWKTDKVYVAQRLAMYWKAQGKRLVIAFDNTDQLPPVLQDHCFLLAQSITRDLGCIGIISMREERYCRARTVGVLDAYQNAGFHLAAPDLVGVFEKRIRLVVADIGASNRRHISSVLPEDAPSEELQRFFLVCLRQFRDGGNALKRFLEECSRDNTRLALTLFGQFLSSGYTHVEEMVAHPHWTVIDHQVVKPMMIPQRFNYTEDKSLIPNLFQYRNSTHGSHFTSIRILHALRHSIDASPDKGGYWRVDVLIDEFETKFGMRHDCESALNMMLGFGLVEANNRLDSYSVEKAGSDGKELIFADELRITAFGIYMLDFLCRSFTYIDLVSLDCGLTDETLYHSFCASAAKERAFGPDKRSRLESRLERATKFVQYLKDEEDQERSEYLLTQEEAVMPAISLAFEADKARAIESAKRNT
jgi:hypothetical protein